MRKFLVAGTLLLVVFVGVFRQRIFLRDPLGKVKRSGVSQDGARVYINYSNDVLVEDAPQQRFVLVQNWNGIPGVPKRLACVTMLACWTDADEATVFSLSGSEQRASMSAKEVSFTNDAGEQMKVELR